MSVGVRGGGSKRGREARMAGANLEVVRLCFEDLVHVRLLPRLRRTWLGLGLGIGAGAGVGVGVGLGIDGVGIGLGWARDRVWAMCCCCCCC